MDYEQKYKKALETARKINSGEGVAAPPDWTVYEVIFPELKESEDERIRKALINLFKVENFNGYVALNGIDVDDVIAWLEKQGEQRSKLVDFDYNAKDSDLQEVTYFIPNGFHAEMDGNKVIIKRGEQKPAIDFRAEDWYVSKVDGKIHNIYNSGVEPKFKVRDWIVSKWGEIYQIKEVMSGSYNLLCTNNAEEINSITQVDNNSRLLCIGDIKKLEEQGKKKNVDAESLSKTILASHGNPFEKPKWTEEDECYMGECISAIATKDGWSFEEKRKTKHWLKSLKQRMGGEE